MSPDPSRETIHRGEAADGGVADLSSAPAITLGGWIQQVTLGGDEAAEDPPSAPREVVESSRAEENDDLSRPPPAVEAPEPQQSAPKACATTRLREELQDAVAAAVAGVRNELDDVYRELCEQHSQTREVIANALGRLAGRIDRVEILSADGHRQLQSALDGVEDRLRVAETKLEELEVCRNLAPSVAALLERLDRVETAALPGGLQWSVSPAVEDHDDPDDLFERSEQTPLPRVIEGGGAAPHRGDLGRGRRLSSQAGPRLRLA